MFSILINKNNAYMLLEFLNMNIDWHILRENTRIFESFI